MVDQDKEQISACIGKQPFHLVKFKASPLCRGNIYSSFYSYARLLKVSQRVSPSSLLQVSIMLRPYSIVFLSFFVCCWGHFFTESDIGCELAKRTEGESTFPMRREYRVGKVNTIIYSVYEVLEDSYEPKVAVERSITECDGKRIVQVKTTVKSKARKYGFSSPHDQPNTEKLLFYHKGAKNVVVSPDGITATRINEFDEETHGGVLTNRPLKDDELFEVKIDRIIIKYKDTIGIGVSQYTPTGMDYLDWLVCGTIMLYDHRLYEHGNIYKRRYGGNLRTLRVGDRLGVMRKSNGNLHFFMNGEDQGVAKSNVTYPVYGALDLYGKYVQASIIS